MSIRKLWAILCEDVLFAFLAVVFVVLLMRGCNRLFTDVEEAPSPFNGHTLESPK